jgi:plastocyanin
MKKIRVFRATVIALIAGLLLCVSPGLVAAVDIPSGPPHAFYGNVLINGNPAPAGTKVEAKGTGVKTTAYNPLITTVAGQYGTSGAIGDKLIVQGITLVEGTILTFYVKDVSTGQTIAWHSGYKTKLDLAVTISAPTTTGGGGGGGGGGNTLTTNLFGSKGTFTISSIGRVLDTIVVTSPDGKLKITIPVNTIARDKLGHPLSSLTVDVDPDPSCPVPEDEHIIGLAYSFKPDGATFSPPIEIVFTYDPDELSEGVLEEELILAFCDEASGEWVQVAGDVNKDNNTITAHISHFTTYAIIGKGITIVVPPAPTPVPTPVPTPLPPKPTPAVFSPKSMIVSSAEVNPGETLTISVSVTNTGGEAGTHDVILKVAGVKESSKSISLNPGESTEVSFTISREKPGTYQIECDSLPGSFVVKEAVVKPVTPTPEVPAAPKVTEEGIQWWIWLIIAAVVLIGVGTGWYFYSRRVKT